MTCMALDTAQRRLITGAEDGSCRLWNFSNGQCLQRFGGVQKELGDVMYVDEGNLRYIVSGGWSQRVFLYKDEQSTSALQPWSHCIPPQTRGHPRPQQRLRRRPATARVKRLKRPQTAHPLGTRQSGYGTARPMSARTKRPNPRSTRRPISAHPLSRAGRAQTSARSHTVHVVGHSDDITCMVHCPSRIIVTGGADGCIVAWSLESGHRLWKVSVAGAVVALAFRKQEKVILSVERMVFFVLERRHW